MKPMQSSFLARYLLFAYMALIFYASLYPLMGWRNQGVGQWAFLLASFPRYFTWFDIMANLFAYMPFGFLIALTLYPHWNKRLIVVLSLAAGFLLSFFLETLQNFLPNRIPSNIDLCFNTLGTLFGTFLGTLYAPRLLAGSAIYKWRHRWFGADKKTDLGLVLLGLWLFTQLSPMGLLFGNGDLRSLISFQDNTLYSPKLFIRFEIAIVICNIVGVGLLVANLAKQHPYQLTLLLIISALIIKTLAVALLYKPENFMIWATRATLIGIVVGILVCGLLFKTSRGERIIIAILVFIVATLLVNFAPENPYFVSSLQLWQQGQFLNFNGLTKWVSILWPFLAISYLFFLIAEPKQ